MHNLLTDPLLHVRPAAGEVEALSLPEVYEALAGDRVAAFPALRPHQRHAWHAFLAQLGVIACHRAGGDAPPASGAEWRSFLRGLTPDFDDDEPWRLIVEDPARPAFMQCPAPKGIGDYRNRITTPDDLDVLVTSKNHDLKQTVAVAAAPEDWMLALIGLQTMAGYFGAGNYGIARMNGGYSTRPCLGLAPADGGLGAHLFHDMRAMLARRGELLDDYPDYFRREDGSALLWLEPWDGSGSLDLRALDPYFIEICRRMRLRSQGSSIVAFTASSRAPRIAAKAASGDVGDFWTPVSRKDGKALSLSPATLRYDRLADLIFREAPFKHPPAMKVDPAEQGRWRLVARGVAGGQGKTEGYYERTDVAFNPRTVRALSRREQRNKLAGIAKALMVEIGEVNQALRFGVATAASGGKAADKLTRADRKHADPYSRRLDAFADARFFTDLEARFLAADEEEAALRARFARAMIGAAERLLEEALDSVPCTSIHRHRARARGVSAFRGRLRGARSVFSDQPEIFDRKEAPHAP